MIRIVTRGDDAGSAKAANRAMRDCCTEGILKNISLMACTPQIEHAAEILKPLDNICFGLHGTVNCEWQHPKWGTVADPEKVSPLLDDDGNMFLTVNDLHERKVPIDIIMIEMKAQLDRLRKLGFDVRYLDEHCGFGWIDGLADALTQWAKEEGLIFRPEWKRLKVEGEFLKHPDAMIAMLQAAPEGDYLKVAHPCYIDAESMKIIKPGGREGETANDRDGQRQIFMHPDIVKQFHERSDLVPIRYDEI